MIEEGMRSVAENITTMMEVIEEEEEVGMIMRIKGVAIIDLVGMIEGAVEAGAQVKFIRMKEKFTKLATIFCLLHQF